jgi:hypothetical protein
MSPLRSTSAGGAYSASAWASESASTDLLTATAARFSSSPPPLGPSPLLRCLEKAALPLPVPWWWSESDDCRSHFSASSHLDGTDLLGATSWWWCAGLAKNCNGRPGVAGTTCGGGSARLLCAEAVEEDDEEVVEASWWLLLPPLLLLLLVMVAMGKEVLTSPEVSLRFRLQSGSLDVGPSTLPPTPLPPPTAVAAPTPWNEFCNGSMEQEK